MSWTSGLTKHAFVDFNTIKPHIEIAHKLQVDCTCMASYNFTYVIDMHKMLLGPTVTFYLVRVIEVDSSCINPYIHSSDEAYSDLHTMAAVQIPHSIKGGGCHESRWRPKGDPWRERGVAGG